MWVTPPKPLRTSHGKICKIDVIPKSWLQMGVRELARVQPTGTGGMS